MAVFGDYSAEAAESGENPYVIYCWATTIVFAVSAAFGTFVVPVSDRLYPAFEFLALYRIV